MSAEIIVIRTSKKKTIRLLLGCVMFIAVGIFLLYNHVSITVAWLCILFCGFGVLVSIYRLVTGVGKLIIDRNGITVTALFKPMKLAWSEVSGFGVYMVFRTKMISIDYAVSCQRSRWGQKIAFALTGIESALPDHFDRSAEEVCELLNLAKMKFALYIRDQSYDS